MDTPRDRANLLRSAVAFLAATTVLLLIGTFAYSVSERKSSEELLRDAAMRGDRTVLRVLIDRGVNVNAQDGDGWTPLHFAVSEGNKYIGVENEIRSHNGIFNDDAVAAKYHEVARFLLAKNARVNTVDQHGRTALHYCARYGHVDTASLLLANGAGVDVVDRSGVTPLIMAANNRSIGMAEILIQHGADANATDNYGMTPMHYAVAGRRMDMVCLLVSHSADVNFPDVHGLTPLHKAACSRKRDIAGLLISAGACINARDERDRTPRDIAAETGDHEMEHMLRRHGAR